MSTSIYEIDVLQVEEIVRNVDFPAMQSGPLYRMMFPPAAEMTEGQQNEIIRWYSEGLGDALTFQTDSFLQICAPDGMSLGFCGWTIGPSQPKEINSSTKSNCVGAVPGRDAHQPLPETLDLAAWPSVALKWICAQLRGVDQCPHQTWDLQECNW
ncbi:hypothetical protein F5Y09DRAFT_348456 [Xylaria sp. FL1042]|nr:hypothetical protein F5Y09DRAFT_348456 [Xylaria sp. FL1042]